MSDRYSDRVGRIPTGAHRCRCCEHLLLIAVTYLYVCPACGLVPEWPKRGLVA